MIICLACGVQVMWCGFRRLGSPKALHQVVSFSYFRHKLSSFTYMRLAALAFLRATATTSRLSLAPTARFSVVVARAMSELVGGGEEPTTTAASKR